MFGRNNGVQWTATNDAWRFTPNGTPNYAVSWWNGSTLVSTDTTITVCPAATTTYTAQVIYNLCSGGNLTLRDSVTVHVVNSLNLTVTPPSPSICFGTSDTLTATTDTTSTFKWNNGDTTAIIIVNPTSTTTYTVTATSPACSSQASVTVSVFSPAALSVTNPTICEGQSATITASGATSYKWNNGDSTASISVTPTVTTKYIVTGTVSGCSAVDTAIVTVDSLPNAQINSVINASCGLNNGQATASGGTYYTWSTIPVQSAATATGLAPGLYTVTVSNGSASGCSSTDTITIHSVPGLVVNVVQVDSVLCNGMDDGSITVLATGGNPWYAYIWNTTPPHNTNQITGLAAGTYIVTVTDQSGCSKTLVTAVYQPDPLISTVSFSQPVKCYGQSNGEAKVDVAGGTTAYQYQWDDGESTQTAVDLPVGPHSVTVTDHNGCTSIAFDTITQPTQLGIILTADSAKCWGLPTGGITSVDTGGTPTYHYLWSNGQTGQNLIDVMGSNTGIVYTLTLTDHNGCTASASDIVFQPSGPLTYNVASGTDTVLKCGGPGNNIGSIGINVVGGTYPWTYLWNTIPPQTTQDIMNLSGGTYTITITDHNGCTLIRTFFISQPPPLSIHIDSLDALCRDSCNGQITSSVTGGTPFSGNYYTYSWSNGKTDENIIKLCPGIYDLTVTDANGCKDSVSISVGIKTNVLASFTASPYTGYAPLPVNFYYNGTLSAANIYTWSFGDGTQGLDSLDQAHTYNPVERDSFKVCLTVTDSACKSDTCQWINVEIHSKITVPNVFTPNGDGKNDDFMVRDTSIATFNCIIFNRWGDKIYEWSDVTKGWDGKNNSGSETPDGTYYYIITAKGYDNVSYNLHGAVTLIR